MSKVPRASKPKRIVDRQRASLDRLAARGGMTPERLIAVTEKDTRGVLDHTIAQTIHVINKFGSFAGVPLTKFETSVARMKDRDFWQDLADRERVIHLMAVDAIAKVAEHLPIKWPYLLALAEKHGMPAPSPKPDDMTAFLGAVPCAYLFDHEFNAYIEWNEHGYAPCVFYNTLLLDSLTEVAQLLGLLSEDAKSYSGVDAEEHAERAQFLVERLLGRHLLVRNRPIIEEPSSYLSTIGMTIAAHLFVACHEFAHLLLGHDGSTSSIKAECEADMFATLVVGSTTWPHREFAIASVISLIDIIEADRLPSTTHPSAWDRANVVDMQVTEAKAEIDWPFVYGLLKTVLDKGAEACIGRRIFQQHENKNFTEALPVLRGRPARRIT